MTSIGKKINKIKKFSYTFIVLVPQGYFSRAVRISAIQLQKQENIKNKQKKHKFIAGTYIGMIYRESHQVNPNQATRDSNIKWHNITRTRPHLTPDNTGRGPVGPISACYRMYSCKYTEDISRTHAHALVNSRREPTTKTTRQQCDPSAVSRPAILPSVNLT